MAQYILNHYLWKLFFKILFQNNIPDSKKLMDLKKRIFGRFSGSLEYYVLVGLKIFCYISDKDELIYL